LLLLCALREVDWNEMQNLYSPCTATQLAFSFSSVLFFVHSLDPTELNWNFSSIQFSSVCWVALGRDVCFRRLSSTMYGRATWRKSWMRSFVRSFLTSTWRWVNCAAWSGTFARLDTLMWATYQLSYESVIMIGIFLYLCDRDVRETFWAETKTRPKMHISETETLGIVSTVQTIWNAVHTPCLPLDAISNTYRVPTGPEKSYIWSPEFGVFYLKSHEIAEKFMKKSWIWLVFLLKN